MIILFIKRTTADYRDIIIFRSNYHQNYYSITCNNRAQRSISALLCYNNVTCISD
jgi:hypothetical protein